MHRVWKDRLVEKLRPRPGQRHLDVAGQQHVTSDGRVQAVCCVPCFCSLGGRDL